MRAYGILRHPTPRVAHRERMTLVPTGHRRCAIPQSRARERRADGLSTCSRRADAVSDDVASDGSMFCGELLDQARRSLRDLIDDRIHCQEYL